MALKRLPVIMLIGVLLSCFGGGNLWAGVAISPAFLELSLDNKRPAGQFVIRNTGDQAERYRILASHFDFGEDGALSIIPPDENSLAPWFKFNPKEFTLPPKSRRVVRFVIVPKGKAVSKREYWGVMELESLKANVTSATDKAGRTMKIKVIPAILVPVFATKGEVPYSASLGEIKIEPLESGMSIQATVTNTGKGHLLAKGNYEIIDRSGNIVRNGVLGRNYILPDGRRKFQSIITGDLPQGNYTVEVEYSAPQLEKPIKDSVQYTCVPKKNEVLGNAQ